MVSYRVQFIVLFQQKVQRLPRYIDPFLEQSSSLLDWKSCPTLIRPMLPLSRLMEQRQETRVFARPSTSSLDLPKFSIALKLLLLISCLIFLSTTLHLHSLSRTRILHACFVHVPTCGRSSLVHWTHARVEQLLRCECVRVGANIRTFVPSHLRVTCSHVLLYVIFTVCCASLY